MFDPTAFENLKVVLEGALYDLDFNGEILIIDRNDLINIAKLSRKYEISFQLSKNKKLPITARLELESGLENMAAELLTGFLSERLSGCYIHLQFLFDHQHSIIDYNHIEKVLLDVWGTSRKITHAVTFYPLEKEKRMNSVISLEFERLIYEDQIDDLIEMIDYIITTLYRLQTIQNG